MQVAALPLRPARVWWIAVRPATLAASVAPVLAAFDKSFTTKLVHRDAQLGDEG